MGFKGGMNDGWGADEDEGNGGWGFDGGGLCDAIIRKVGRGKALSEHSRSRWDGFGGMVDGCDG